MKKQMSKEKLHIAGEISLTYFSVYQGGDPYHEPTDAINRFIECYALMLLEGEKYYNDDINNCKKLECEIQMLDKKIAEGTQLRARLYDLNIIPKIYRNISNKSSMQIVFSEDWVRLKNIRGEYWQLVSVMINAKKT